MRTGKSSIGMRVVSNLRIWIWINREISSTGYMGAGKAQMLSSFLMVSLLPPPGGSPAALLVPLTWRLWCVTNVTGWGSQNSLTGIFWAPCWAEAASEMKRATLHLNSCVGRRGCADDYPVPCQEAASACGIGGGGTGAVRALNLSCGGRRDAYLPFVFAGIWGIDA